MLTAPNTYEEIGTIFTPGAGCEMAFARN
jgi:hypothetical protein